MSLFLGAGSAEHWLLIWPEMRVPARLPTKAGGMCVVVVWAPRGGVAGEMETLCDDKVQPTVIIVHEEGRGRLWWCQRPPFRSIHFVLFRWEMLLVLSTANCPFRCCPLFKLNSHLLMDCSEMCVVVSVDDSTERRQGVPTNR